jgi:hypoxanthine-DNA glycosylase
LVHHPLEAVYDGDSDKLILGTMPSPVSREEGFYYMHPRNRFWQVLAAVFDAPFPRNKADKVRLVLAKRLALWDVLASCEIDGASDGSIRAAKANDFSKILSETKITRVFCTGKKAYQLYTKLCAPATGIDAAALPSTSPANQRLSLDELITCYKALES